MELESDLGKIQSEELLRKMWQQSEDINRKKEIRSQLYKLRESRLRDLYQFDIMADNRVTGFGKDPLAPSHGESLADQSFQSLKTKEIRDSMSPTEMKFQSMALNNPSTTGWNVQSSSEVSPDGRGFRAETVASTDGVENVNGGTAEFKGRNEQRSSAMHEGDDKNFVKKASESANTHLQEKVVIGDENSGRTEVRMSSSTSTSSSKVIQSSSTTDEFGQPVDSNPRYLMDSNRAPQRMQEPQYQQRPSQYEPQNAQQEVRRSTDHSTTTQQQTEQYNQKRHETNTSQNVQTNESHEQNKRYVDVDKASPEYQQHVQYLMSQQGEIISNTVEYPKPNVKMITTVKRLPDGTIVRNKRYETEEPSPSSTPSQANITRQTVSNNNTQRRDSQTNQQSKNYQGQAPSERMRRPQNDVVDNVETTRYAHDVHSDSVSNMETKHSTMKTSNRKFSTETTSETIQESDDSHYHPGSSRPKPVTNDFSTHGFPSVRSNKPTQEFASDRPQSARPNQGYPSQKMTSPNRDDLIPARVEFEPVITERRIPTNDGEVIIVSSEKKRNVKQQTNSERIIETDIRTTDDNRYQQQISDVNTTHRNQDFTTHGFPSVKEPQAHPTSFPDISQIKHHDPTPGYPVGPRPAPLNTSSYAPHAPHDDVVVVSSQKSHTSQQSSNTERIIETEILGEDGRPRPRQPAGVEYITTHQYTVTTPGDQVPRHEYPGVARQSPGRDHPTQGFPSVRSPTGTTPDYSTHGFPSARDTHKPSGTPERPQASPIKTYARPSSSPTKPRSTTVETTKRVIQKEKEVDSAHRAFAASLRSSSPVDSTRRDSYSTDGPRHTPRSSVSSTKHYRRDMREGSHDSAAGSEASRLSTTTVTRQTPPRTVGGRTVVTKQTVVTSKNNQGSNELINVSPSPRGTKSPSPGKSTTTTTTTRTVTSKAAAPKDVPKSDNQHTTTTTTNTTSKNDTTFPINHDSLTITKKNISDNQSHSKLPQSPVVEEPCIKKQYYLLGPSDQQPTTAHKQEPSPRSSPAPSSRSSPPYPSKSKSPLGDDDQTVKSHTSRPLSPSSTSRSPKPIGSKDVPNSRDPHPHHQRPTKVDRETTFEQIDKTSSTPTRRRPLHPNYTTEDEVFITEEDYLLQQEDVDATQNLKRKTKQLITHEREPVSQRVSPVKPGMAKTTRSPQEPHRVQTVVTRRTDRLEETKRPRPSDHTSPSARQSLPVSPKSGSPKTTPAGPTQSPRKPQSPTKPSTRVIDDKRQSIPKSGSPERVYPSERKPQTPSQPGTSYVPKSRTPKQFDDKPRSGSPERVYPSDTEDEPISTNVREISEITVQMTNKNLKKTQKEIDELIEEDYTTTKSRPHQPKSYEPRESADYPGEGEPTSMSPHQQPKSSRPGQRETTDYPVYREPTPQQEPKSYGPGQKEPRDYPADREPSQTPQHPKSHRPGQKETTDYPVYREPASKSPQQEPKSYGPGQKEPRDYPVDREPSQTPQRPISSRSGQSETIDYSVYREPTSKYPQEQPKDYGPGQKEPRDYPDDREPSQTPQHPKSHRPGHKETTDYPVYREPASKSPQQEPKSYGPGQKEPRDYPVDREPSQTPQQPKSRRPEEREPLTNYPGDRKSTSRSPESQSKNYGPGPKVPKTTDYPQDKEPTAKSPQQQPKNYGPGPKEPKPTDYSDARERELFMSTAKINVKTNDTNDSTQKNITTTIHEQFIEAERPHPELPDGAFISKSPEEPTTSPQPTFKKKGVSRRDTFEDRCRQILGMEEYGDTPGAFKKRPTDEVELLEEDEKNVKTKTEKIQKSTFEVKIEDCGDDEDDDEPISINSVKRNLVVRKTTTSDDEGPQEDVPRKTTLYKEPLRSKPNVEDSSVKTTENVYTNVTKKRLPDTTSDSEPELMRPRDTYYETVEITKKRTDKSDLNVTKRPTSRSPTKSVSPTFDSPKDTCYETMEVINTRTDKSDIDFTVKPSRRSPTRSVSPPYRAPKEETLFETVEVTRKRMDTSDNDVTKKPTSKSPTRPLQTTYENIEVTNKQMDVTKKPTSKSPTRSESPTFRSPKETTSETIEVTNKRIEKSDIDVTKKTTSRSVQPTPESPRRQQPVKPDSTKKHTTKKPTDEEPYYDTSRQGKVHEKVKPTTKKPTDDGPNYDTPRQGKTPTEVRKEPMKKKPTEDESFVRTTETVYITKEFPETTSDSEPETRRPKGNTYQTVEVTKRRVEKDSDITKRPTSRSPTKSVSPTFESPKRKPSKTTDVTTKSTTKQTVKDDRVTETSSIKDRLRSSVGKDKSPKKRDQVDAESSPETSPTRHTERRRSSNISVNTEIIIDHTESETTAGKKPKESPRKPQDSIFKEIIDSTIMPDKMPRKMPVTERKESAPVHRVTHKDKDSKMSRSTSEKLIKVMKKPETITTTTTTTTTSTLTPPSSKMSPKPSADHRRPNKCFATKTINLSATDRLMSSEDMENVIIDIQHAKSSREPSPDKIIPTPVPAHLDTGKPRYPDVVQEPEDEPRKKPIVKNIPIFEEEHNTFVGCHISEVNRKTYDRSEYREDDVLSTPVVEAPPSLDYPTSDKSYPIIPVPDDECLLSVHDKVSKFQHIAEEVKKPKTSSPFNREFDDITRVPDDDECLLTVDEKVDKFIKTAESLTNQPLIPTPTRDIKRPFPDETTDEDLETIECTFTAVKLAPTAPQRSPELVRHISRHISRQSDGGEPTETEPTTTEPTDSTTVNQHTHESREEYETNSKRRTAQESVTHRRQQTSAVKQPRRPVVVAGEYDDEELVPHTATHTTRIEQRRQKDILTRPSVFDTNNNNNSSNGKQPANKVNKTQPKYVSPSPKDSEKQRQPTQSQQRPQIKSRAKPEPLNEKTVTTSSTTTTTSNNKRQQQSPQRRGVVDTDCDYRRGSSSSNVVTSVSSTTNKQTTTKPLYSTNGPKKSPQSLSAVTPSSVVHKRQQPDRQSPLHTNKTKNLKHVDDDDDVGDYVVEYEEFQVEVVPNDSETELIINSDTARRSTTTKTIKNTGTTGKINVRKEPTTQHITTSSTTTSPTTRKMKEIPQGYTPSSSSPSSPTSKNTKAHVVNLTERSTLKHNTTTSTTKSVDRSDTNETSPFPDSGRPPKKNTPTYPQKTNKVITTTDSVAARRSLFENHNSPKPTSARGTPTSSPSSGRRPSYMDHTKSSLEHIRRDSLELNKTNYTRKPSGGYEDELHPSERNTQVKFDVPQKQRPDHLNLESEEDVDIEEIFELEILERMLETVTSYELRRRIRAQIRLVKKNLLNVEGNNKHEISTTKTTHRERSLSPETKTKTQVTTKKQYFYKEEQHEEERRSSSTHTSPERTKISVTKITRTHSPETQRKPTSPSYERTHSPQHKPSPTRVSSKPQHGRSPSPDTKLGHKEIRVRESSKKQYVYRGDDDEEQVERVETIYKETSPTHRRPSRKSVSPHSSPERHQVDNTKSLRVTDRSSSPREKKPSQARVCSKSPENKFSSVHKTDTSYDKSAVTSVKQQKRVTPSVQTPKTKPEPKAPVWADRKNLLKTPGTTTATTTSPRKPTSVTDSRTSSLSKTVKSSTNQSQKHTTTNKSSYVEDDCITSSYGIGPTDENGLPLFGIRALKKKKPTSDPCETTEEVTGYVVEEKYYSDNKSKPIVERKELIYSTNPEELNAIKEKVKETTVRSIKSQGIGNVDEPRSTYKTNQKTSTSVRSSPEEFLESSTTKYVRRGSVKEMSEKFIHKESSSMVSEKSKNYPKAGLILRTNSRKHSRDSDNMDGDNMEYYETRTHHHRGDSEEDDVCLVGEGDLIMVESESESESIKKTKREFKQVTSKKSSSSRSFLNTKGEEKVVTSVDDVLDRMRNADNVVEEGDTAEDQEARALLNKFLGASIIMKGVESAIPPINRETKLITTTTTGSGRHPEKHEVKTTRVTKTIKSGSSSSPVIETTCDIEEIWDEEILKQLLEQARTYEERRKIRSRLRELMAERSEKNCQQAGKQEEEEAAGTTTDEQSNLQRSDSSSASEYEEIIEEVTDYSEDDDDDAEEETTPKSAAVKESVTVTTEEENESSSDLTKTDSSKKEQTDNPAEGDAPPTTTAADSKSAQVVETTEALKTPDDITDSSVQGESAMPTMHQQKMLQANQATNSQKLGISSNTYSKTAPATTSAGGNNSKASNSDRSMHAPPNNKSSSTSAPSYASQNPPIVTLTAGRTDNSNINNTSFRDVGNSLDVGIGNSSRRQVDRLGVPQKEDSGTESGEDLRLIAAGLRDQLQMKSDSNIIDDVTCALSRLENSLKEGNDIAVDTEKRKALLALVGRLQAGLTSPEKLAEIAAAMSELDGNNDGLYAETSSPEADAHRSGRQRFAKRRSRIDRHTVGVSREELADARRYMEDMLIMDNASNSITPEAANTNSPPQWFPLEKNASSGAVLVQQAGKQNMFQPENTMKNQLSPTNNGKRRPVSGDFSVSFGLEPTLPILKPAPATPPSFQQGPTMPVDSRNSDNGSPDSNSKFARFSNKKLLMKRANTIDIAKTKKFHSDLDTDSDAEDRAQLIGLKRAVHPTVKKRVHNAVPPFEPKTENDRKFLAFINKQSDKPGLGWTTSRSVSNWTSKFGSLKHSFEAGGSTVTAAKPPQVPGHIHAKPQQSTRQPPPPQRDPTYLSTNQQIAQRLQQEAERQAEERRRKLEYERLEYELREREKMEYEHREREKLEHLRQQQQQRERLERERLEREYYEREIRERNQRAAAAQQNATKAKVPKPIPINEFKHAPQSVFRPIDNGDAQPKGIYKPIPQLPTVAHSWQAPTNGSRVHHPPSPNNYARPDNSFITSPPPSSKSPIGLPWASKPAVDSSSFKHKANKFEERSRYDNYSNGPMLQRHNSLRASNVNVSHNDDFKKRPSLPNTVDPYSVSQDYQPNNSFSYAPPPPTNISFTYNNRPSKPTYLSYPCLPTAVSEYDNYRCREDSLTNPQAVPLVLTSANPTYCPPQQAQNQQQQYLPRDTVQPFDIMSPTDSALTSPSVATMMQTDCTDDDIDSDTLCEYRAVSKVMGKPQSQTAVTVGRRTGHVSDDEVFGKNSKAAKNLLSTMKNIGNNDNKRQTRAPKRPEAPTSPKVCLSPDGRSYQAPLVEPLFPDLTKFEPNRKPLYDGQPKPQATPTAYKQQNALYGQPRKQPTMYKSLENITKRIPPPTNLNNHSMYAPRQPSPKPYISETQAAYVVTYPTDDTTDDEDHHSRYSGYSQKGVPDSLPLGRTRNISETSTASSNTTSMTYAHNLPSPNTSWTSNPITADDHVMPPPVGQNYYEQKPSYTSQQPARPTDTKSAMTRPEDHHVMPSMSAPYQYSQPPASSVNYTNAMPTPYAETQYSQVPQAPKIPEHTTKPSASAATTNYNGSIQYTKPTPTMSYESPPTQATKAPTVGQKKPSAPAPKQQQPPKTPPQSQQSRPAIQKSSEYKPAPSVTTQTQSQQTPVIVPTTKKPKQSSATQTVVKPQEKANNKKSLLNMRQTVSEDHQQDRKATVSTVREQNTSVLKEATGGTKITQQQSERIVVDTRRKSLGNSTMNYQQTEERRTNTTETQQSQKPMYKSSAPADTPDIVKSSLPKDENQPILKKFGPPQRHHYMPNSYQSPLGKTSGGNTAAATPVATSAAVHTKHVEVTTNAKQPQQSSTSTTEKTETKGRDGAVVTTTTKVTTRTVSGGTGPKTVSPFTKFKQLDRQNSQQSTKSPTKPSTPGGGGSSATPSVTGNAPIFKFTDPALNARAATVKDQLLQWCQSKTKEYENVQITNFSACWVDGLAFCALIHHFLPDAFDYSQLTPQNRRKNFELAFTVADEKAGIAPLLDVEDMVVMKRPDWKCVFVYVQSIYRRFRNCQ